MRKQHTIYGYHDRINETIKKTGLSKAELAKRCGFDRRIFYGDGMLSTFNIARFCKVTGVSADWLLGLTRRPTQ